MEKKQVTLVEDQKLKNKTEIMAFKMKGHTLPGIKQREVKDSEYGELSAGKRSPNKWFQFIPIALSAISSMKKNKEEKE